MHRVVKEGPILVRGISLHLPFSHSVSRVHAAVRAVSPQEYSTLANDYGRGTCCLFNCCSIKVDPSRVRIASPRYLKRVRWCMVHHLHRQASSSSQSESRTPSSKGQNSLRPEAEGCEMYEQAYIKSECSSKAEVSKFRR